MPLNALGNPLQLQASPTQLQDIFSSLQPGDQLRGRVVDLLPDGKAIVNLRGQNVVAQLPTGSQVQRGDILSLQVSAQPGTQGSGAAGLLLRLLPTQAAEGGKASPVPPNPLPILSSALLDAASLDQAIAAAKLPVNSVSQAAARTLADLGVSLEPKVLAQVVHATESLIGNEQASPRNLDSALNQRDSSLRQAVGEGIVQLRAAALSAPAPRAQALLQAARSLQTFAPAASATPSSPLVAQAEISSAPPASGGQTKALPAEAARPAEQFALLLERFLAEPTPARAAELPLLIRNLMAEAPPSSTSIADPGPQAANQPSSLNSPTAAANSADGPAQTPVSPQTAPPPGPSGSARADARIGDPNPPAGTGLQTSGSWAVQPSGPAQTNSAQSAALNSGASTQPQAGPTTASLPAKSENISNPAAPPQPSSAVASAALPSPSPGTQSPGTSTAPQYSPANPAGKEQPAQVPGLASPRTSPALQTASPEAAANVVAAAPNPAPGAASSNTGAAAAQSAQLPQSDAPLAKNASVPTAGAPAPALSASTSAAIPVQLLAQREALAQWLAPLQAKPGPYAPAQLAAAASAAARALERPDGAAARSLLDAVQVQAPGAQPAASLATARQTLTQLAAHYAQQPGSRSIPNAAALQAELRALELPAPRADLSSLAPDTVASAVAWLSARGLPPQRPLVETVAGWIAQDRNALPAARQALQAQAELDPALLDQRPSLRSAFADLQLSMDAAAFRPESPNLVQQLQRWSQAQGMDLEVQLADLQPAQTAAPKAIHTALEASTVSPQPANPAPPLRTALLRLEKELHSAMGDAATPLSAKALNRSLEDAQAAVRALNAVPLQAQAAPAFDTVHVPLPVWMNNTLGNGQLSVTWRKGRERELDEKEPVSVAVALQTESLGEVKFLMQVWKEAAQARVVARDQETARFLATGEDELKAGFAERTPFKLTGVDFVVNADAKRPGSDESPEPRPSGLSFSA